jgi:hypothetical protein
MTLAVANMARNNKMLIEQSTTKFFLKEAVVLFEQISRYLTEKKNNRKIFQCGYQRHGLDSNRGNFEHHSSVAN